MPTRSWLGKTRSEVASPLWVSGHFSLRKRVCHVVDRRVTQLQRVAPIGKMKAMTEELRHAVAFTIGPKGRSVLPAAIRRAAHLEEGTEVVAIALGEGRVLLETVDAVRRRVWAGAPDPEVGGAEATADARRMRDEDVAVSDAAASRRGAPRTSDRAEDHGAALLAKLGL